MIRVGGEFTPLVDCDVHESLPSMDVLFPYLDKPWQRLFAECNFRSLPTDPYTATAHGGRRVDSWPEDGGPPGSDYDLTIRQLIDDHGVDYAILTSHFYRVSAMPQVDFATALASAYNDWMIDTWLSRDDILYGSLQVALQDPKGAAREIDRLGGHPKIVQVLFPQAIQRAYGDPVYDPVYEAIVRNKLLVALHPTGNTGLFPEPGLTGSWPRTYMEFHANFALSYQAQMASIVCEGTLVKFPELQVVLLEAGFNWLPHVLWTLDVHWKSLQHDVPWLTRKPSAYIHEHFHIGTQPIIAPDNVDHFLQVLEMIDADSLLIYASDYPHWDFDSPTRFLPREVGDETRRRLLGLNALQLYGFPSPASRPQRASAQAASQ